MVTIGAGFFAVRAGFCDDGENPQELDTLLQSTPDHCPDVVSVSGDRMAPNDSIVFGNSGMIQTRAKLGRRIFALVPSSRLYGKRDRVRGLFGAPTLFEPFPNSRVSFRRIVLIAFVAMFFQSLAVSTANADVTIPAIFGDHMVLQLGVDLPFWGKAESGEEVTVTIVTKQPGDGQKPDSISVTTGADGRWFAKLPARMKSGTVEVTISGKNTISLTDVLIGDVWVCSGQSNMEWPVSGSLNHQEEIAAAKFPSIRIFKVERSTARVPLTDLDGKWVVCSPETVEEVSAVGYYFGRELHQRLKRPIGLVQVTFGGAICEAWISNAALRSDEDFARILERAERANSDPDQANNPNRASVLFNGMIAPLRPFSMKGVIWYQGESNVARAFQYRKLFPLMIADWRRGWGQGEFPFLYVQLANYVSEKSKPDHPEFPEESAWAELREAQSMSLAVPKTAMVVTVDIGESRDIHPKNKQDVGYRLALSALHVAYGRDVIASGPVFKSMYVVGSEIHLKFQHAEGLHSRENRLIGFAVAGRDQVFVWADARIDGTSVYVSAEKVLDPVAVRYAWEDNPAGNLVNGAGLPASPFRTDEWPGITTQNK